MMVSSGLLDSGFSGSNFTWSNNRQGQSYVATKIDHSLTNQALSLSFPDGLLQHLVRQNIDHSPILLSSRPPLAARYIPFKFEEMWIGYPSFKDLVATIWNLPAFPRSIKAIKEVLEAYELAAGKHFNLRKSHALFGNSRQSFKVRVSRSLGIP
ncbi:hypothetical protein MRB53_009832 [Persea americana]|uniref:Uncharacterized protein n=1 Tax=Persea americana TaxID=3435 RepID=A0ACC2LQ43_PERAE|nr:hypothetical protein MRB53_009832 [Persea americana]